MSTNNQTALLELQSVCKAIPGRDAPVLIADSIDLKVQRCEAIAIIGVSGSGKSSLLEIMGTLSQPDTGHIIFDGADIATCGERARTNIRRRKIGFLFQGANLIDYLTTEENVSLPLKYQSVPHNQRRERANALLETLGLQSKANIYVNRLSGGERQRVALARALVTQPEIVLADEPTGSLDHETGAEIMELLVRLTRQGSSLVVVTHNRDYAHYFGRVFRMGQGKLWQMDHDEISARA